MWLERFALERRNSSSFISEKAKDFLRGNLFGLYCLKGLGDKVKW